LIKHLFLTLGVLASPASAQSIEGVWKSEKDRIAAPPAFVSFPRSFNGLTLNQTGEASHKGESLDNTALYFSVDGTMKATIYLYMPAYADAAIASHMTDRSIRLIYGSDLKLLSSTIVSIGGQQGAAIRTTYTGGVLKDSGPLASGAAFAHVGRWIIVLRVTGPVDRQPEVESALDSLLASIRFDRKAYIFPVAPLALTAPCPAVPSGPVKAIQSDKSGANALVAAIGGLAGSEKPKRGQEALSPPFPANGLEKACLRGVLASSKLDILQPAQPPETALVLVPFNDSGDMLEVRKNLLGEGYTLSKHEIGRTLVLGEMDRMPDNEQISLIMSGAQPDLLKLRSTTTLTAKGDSTVNISSDTLKP
jgi:hypothetical protein